jgi:hypothetical protein
MWPHRGPGANSPKRNCRGITLAHASRERDLTTAERYLTVSVPNIPATRWPGAWQKNV